MKPGDVVYIPKRKQYGTVHEVLPEGKVKLVHAINPDTGLIEIVDVLDLIVEAAGLIMRIIFQIRLLFAKKAD